MKRLAILSLLAAAPAAADMLPGYDRFDVEAAHRARPLAASVWYPAAGETYRAPIGGGPIFAPVPAFMGPAVAEGVHPLVLLSHVSDGNADALGWLSAALVARGAIVLAVNHPGSTSGDSSPRRSVDLASRAADLTEALDALLAHPSFRAHVDPMRGDFREALAVEPDVSRIRLREARDDRQRGGLARSRRAEADSSGGRPTLSRPDFLRTEA